MTSIGTLSSEYLVTLDTKMTMIVKIVIITTSRIRISRTFSHLGNLIRISRPFRDLGEWIFRTFWYLENFNSRIFQDFENSNFPHFLTFLGKVRKNSPNLVASITFSYNICALDFLFLALTLMLVENRMINSSSPWSMHLG